MEYAPFCLISAPDSYLSIFDHIQDKAMAIIASGGEASGEGRGPDAVFPDGLSPDGLPGLHPPPSRPPTPGQPHQITLLAVRSHISWPPQVQESGQADPLSAWPKGTKSVLPGWSV